MFGFKRWTTPKRLNSAHFQFLLDFLVGKQLLIRRFDVSDQFLYGESEAVLLVYDVTNRKSFADLTLWLEVGCGAKLDGSGVEY